MILLHTRVPIATRGCYVEDLEALYAGAMLHWGEIICATILVQHYTLVSKESIGGLSRRSNKDNEKQQ